MLSVPCGPNPAAAHTTRIAARRLLDFVGHSAQCLLGDRFPDDGPLDQRVLDELRFSPRRAATMAGCPVLARWR